MVVDPGRQLGKYQILQHMATGGMAELYLARQAGIEDFEKLVVIKRILPATANDPDAIKMLLDEARIVATLHHGNIVQVFDIGEADGEYFIAMEYLHGRDVHAIATVARGRGIVLDESEALSIVLGVCAGLHHAHEKTDDYDRPLGIVHRDVSPTNVIVTFDGGVKVVDFGLVKAAGRATESRSGALKGKLAYMAPEQCRARPVDRRTDVFALSIILWELTTGKRLYTGDCDYDLLTAILERDAPAPSTVVPGYPPALEQIVMRGLARDPAARWNTMEDLQLALEDYARERKLKISPITLRRLMERLFADDLEAWRSARRSGVIGVPLPHELSLALGSASEVLQSSDIDAPVAQPHPTAQRSIVAPPSQPRRRARWPLAAGIVVALGGAGVVAWMQLRPASTSTSPSTPTPPVTEPAKVEPATAEPAVTEPAAQPTAEPAVQPTTENPPAAATSPTGTDPSTTEPAADDSAKAPAKPAITRRGGKAPKASSSSPPPGKKVDKTNKPTVDHDSLFPE